MKILVIGDFHKKISKKFKSKIEKQDFDLVIAVGDYGGVARWRPYIFKNIELAKKGKERMTLEEFFGKQGKKKLLKEDEETAIQVLETLNSLGKPVYFIFGNSDDDWYDCPFDKDFPYGLNKKRERFLNKLKNMKDITYKKRKFKGISLVGFGGYIDSDLYLNKDFSKDEDVRKKRLKKIQKAEKKLENLNKNASDPKVFVFHYPPYGYFDKIKSTKDNPNNNKHIGIGFFTRAIKKYNPSLVLFGHMHEYQGKKKLGNSVLVNPGAAEQGKFALVDLDEKEKEVKNIRFIK